MVYVPWSTFKKVEQSYDGVFVPWNVYKRLPVLCKISNSLVGGCSLVN